MPNELEYEPAEVILIGRLSHQILPGPPNYESVKRGDAAEPAFILQLEHPVNVRAGGIDPELNTAEKNVRRIHVWASLDDDAESAALERIMKSLVGRDVVLKATLMHGHTGHHRTDVVGMVKQIKRKGADAFIVPQSRNRFPRYD